MSVGGGRRVLLVEDAVEMRLLARMALGELGGFVVDEAEDGEAGLAAARQGEYDAVVLDVGLPGLDGPALLSTLRADPATAGTPVVFLTGSASSDRERLCDLGATGVLAKPFDVLTLADELDRLLA